MKALCLILICSFASLFSETLVIAVAGPSGAGKTTLAYKLAENLGDQATVINQDSYYHDLSKLPIEKRTLVNFDHPNSIDFELMKTHILALKKGKTIEQPIYDFKIHSRIEKTTKVEPKKILIVEGCLLLAVPEIRDLFDIKIFVDVDLDICLCRRIERDQKERARSFPDIQKQHFTTVRPMYLEFIAPSKMHADMIIPTHRENKMILDFIATRLGPYQLKTG